MKQIRGLLLWPALVGAAALGFVGSGLAFAQQIDYNTQIKNKPSAVGFPAASDHIQFVSPNGNDANDGLSWASAKLTCPAALAAIGANNGFVFESPALPTSDCIAPLAGFGTQTATGLNGYLWSPNQFYVGPTGQATSVNTGFDSHPLRLVGSVWDAINLHAADDIWKISVNDFSSAFTDGSNLIIQHGSVSNGAGRVLDLSDFVVGNPRDATPAVNSNSFAFDNQGAYFDGGSQAMLWEMGNTVNCNGCALSATIFRQNWVPIFNSACTGCQAEYALGGSGNLGVSGNYSGPPKWLWTNLRGSTFNTGTFEHSNTAPRTWTFPDASGALTINASSTSGQVAFNTGGGALSGDTNLFWDNTNKRLGIGQNVPLVPLHEKTTASGGWPQYETENAATGGGTVFFGLSDTGNGSGGNKFLISGTNSSTAALFSLDFTSGRMGVGTVSPGFAFDVNGSVNTTAGYRVSGTGTTGHVLRGNGTQFVDAQLAYSDLGGSPAAAGSTGQVQFNSSGALAADSNFFWDNTNKRLGIGQSTPTVPLHLKTTASGGAMQVEIENSATGGTTWYLGSTDNGNGSGGGKLVVNSSTSTGSAILTLDSATQNVGVNQTSPAKSLDVNGSANIARSVYTGINNVAFSTTPNFDLNLGTTQTITLTSNVTSSTIANSAAGQIVAFVICQDATGGRTFVWPTQFHGAMTVGATASKCNAQNFVAKDASNYYALGPGVVNQ